MSVGGFVMSPERKKLILALAVIFAVNIFIIALAQRASAELYKKGSGGAAVSEIQTRLKNWGYYNGDVDGVYGSQTEKAVRWAFLLRETIIQILSPLIQMSESISMLTLIMRFPDQKTSF